MAKRSEIALERRLKVTLTADDIEGGERNDSAHCMFAEAIKKAYPKLRGVTVDLATIRFTDPDQAKRYICLTPPRVQEALLHFDRGIHSEEFSFRMVPAIVTGAGYVTKPNGKRQHRSQIGKPKVRKASKTHAARPGGKTNKAPVVEGGRLPPREELSNVRVNNKASKKRAVVMQARAVAADSNITLKPSGRGRIRRFGLRQLKP